ncbi:MAG: nuclear transport factor 2 family protein [Deltaproteobacteria bacterium]|nr:nuclear transport factor 2 family protein [Deltaproteobacteria bacterium]MBW2401394.1 nuclear transport factor 2 family protein [Deltaproteobacteria bacterium]MBW2666352.1 nuclear transport factor 2 family protein [Deltaproteobacteria bacterium]
MDPENVVRNFCKAFERQDIEELLDYFSEEAVYENVPIGAATGKEAIRTTLQQFVVPGSEAKFEILWLASSGAAVLTERIDHLTIGNKQVSLRVMGTFEVSADGKLSAWRDYFDMAQLTAQIS